MSELVKEQPATAVEVDGRKHRLRIFDVQAPPLEDGQRLCHLIPVQPPVATLIDLLEELEELVVTLQVEQQQSELALLDRIRAKRRGRLAHALGSLERAQDRGLGVEQGLTA